MQRIKLTLKPTLQQARFAAITASSIAEVFYHTVTKTHCSPVCHFAQAVELSVGEACTNSIQHRPENDRGVVNVTFELEQNSLSIIIRDRNAKVDFDNFSPPKPNQIQEGGYGLHIIKTAMDHASYRRVDGWNIFNLRKYCSKEMVK